jgi:hypothetical protein
MNLPVSEHPTLAPLAQFFDKCDQLREERDLRDVLYRCNLGRNIHLRSDLREKTLRNIDLHPDDGV